MSAIVLCMIVKNEAHVIRRCLTSVRPFITRWCICDTGSTDGTQEAIRWALGDLPGELHERPWVDQQHNRNEAIDLARLHGDYLLLIDADEELQPGSGFVMPPLIADGYEFTVQQGGWEWGRCQLVSTRYRWHFVGKRHPGLHGDGASVIAAMPGMYTVAHSDGASWQDPEKYKRHAAEMQAEVDADPDNPRLRYYLAQSYRDAGEVGKAAQQYYARAQMGGWDEERWSALYQLARLSEFTGEVGDVMCAYLTAYAARPTRAEPLVRLARFLRGKDEHALALLFARQAEAIARPPDRLFVEAEVYRWRALDELTMCLHRCGKNEEAAERVAELLTRVPERELERTRRNQAEFHAALACGQGSLIRANRGAQTTT